MRDVDYRSENETTRERNRRFYKRTFYEELVYNFN